MDGQVRADNTRDLLLHLLNSSVARSPKVLILEDAHWLDPTSWVLLGLVCEQVKRLMLVLVARPPQILPDPLAPEYYQILQLPHFKKLKLDTMSSEDTIKLVGQRLGVDNLPSEVATLITERAQGNPFFSEELAYALRDANAIVINHGECQIAPGISDLNTLSLPNTVQGVVTNRIDRLSPSEQLTLKTASVIGRIFAFSVLRNIYPVTTDRIRLGEYMGNLQRLDITPLETPDPNLAYIFKHVITQEVAYNLMLFSQRRQLHQAVAEWYEHSYVKDLTQFYSLLAYHWGKAEVAPKAVEYLEKAGEQSLRSGAYQEATKFFNDALALHTNALNGLVMDKLRQARWRRQLSMAYIGLGHMLEGRRHLELALELLNHNVPVSEIGVLGRLLEQLAQQLLRRMRPTKLLPPAPLQPYVREVYLEVARTHEQLGEVYFHCPDKNVLQLVANSSLESLNKSERAGTSPELAQAYANMCVTAGHIPIHSLARLYRREALNTVAQINQPGALAWVAQLLGVYAVGLGQWAEAENWLWLGIETYESSGNWNRWGLCKASLAHTFYFQGHFQQSVVEATEMYKTARRVGNHAQMAWGLYQQGEGKLRLGYLDEALSLLQDSLEEVLTYGDSASTITYATIYALLGLVQWRTGQTELALATIATAKQLNKQAPIVVFADMEGYALVAEVYLAKWVAEIQAGHLSTTIQALRAHEAIKSFKRYTRIFPIGQPRLALYQGRYAWWQGQPERAFKIWQRAMQKAYLLKMPYEQGLIHYELGCHSTNKAAQYLHLQNACKLFEQLEAHYDLALAQAALSQLNNNNYSGGVDGRSPTRGTWGNPP
jgi:tetratricopeptide (TPR) repeat protein